MIVKSTKELPNVDLISIDTKKNIAKIALRTNFEEKISVDSLTGEEIKEYQFEEVFVYPKYRQGILAVIVSNFDMWLEKGRKEEILELEKKEKENKTKKLIKDYKQLDINSKTEADIMTSFMGVANLYMENLALASENDKLKADGLVIMEAVAQLYMLITGGMY